MTTLLIMTDGRKDCFTQTWNSLRDNLKGSVDRVLIHDDSGEPAYRQWLLTHDVEVYSTGQRSGFSGAIQSAWNQLDDDYIIHWEDDFILNDKFNVIDFRNVLDRNHYLVQVALKRQPWNDTEIAAGGIIEAAPYDYIEKTDREYTWTEHRKFFTTNPSMYKREIVELGWPQEDYSEGKFGFKVFSTNPLSRSAIFGAKFDRPRVTHIGHERAGSGY